MAYRSDSYIAWDGNRYPGSPPEDWFLAVDNRWWPSPELLGDADSPHAERPEDEATYGSRQTPDRIETAAAPPPPQATQTRPSEPQAAPESWAPDSSPSSEREPSSSGPVAGGQRAQRPRRRSGKKSGSRFFWPIAIFALFRLLSQCDVNLSDINSSEPLERDVEPTTTAERTQAEELPDGSVLFTADTATLLVRQCGENGLTGEVTSTEFFPTSVRFQIDAERMGGGRITPIAAAYTARDLGPFEQRPFIEETSPLVGAGETCEVIDVWATILYR